MSKAYFARDALSNSGIKEILKSPAHFRHWSDNPKEASSALRMGQALHAMVLQPGQRPIQVFTGTKTFNSKAGEQFLAAYQDDICLTADEADVVHAMHASLCRETKIMRLLDSCLKEVEIYGQMQTEFGAIDTKIMADALNQRSIFDLKTTEKSAQDFVWEARKWKYDIQAPWYVDRAYDHDGFRRDFYFIVCEKKPPYGVLMYQASESFLQFGRESCLKAAEIYGRCKALKLWPSYDTNEILTLN